jgi:hydroxymethylbilane synthase
MQLRIGTRGSKLALTQTRQVAMQLEQLCPELAGNISLVPMQTTGDRLLDHPLYEVGGKGLFTKELEEALLAGTIDMAVHSMKDMPAHMPIGLEIAAILEREDPRDALLSSLADSLDALPSGTRLGTSSVRRRAQITSFRPDLVIEPLRGNVISRMEKLAAGTVQATILAVSGLKRLNIAADVYNIVPTTTMLPAVAQGALGIQCCAVREDVMAKARSLTHLPSEICVAAERAFLKVLDGSCRTPLAALATLAGEHLHLNCMIASPDGQHVFTTTRSGNAADAEMLGQEAGEELLRRGGALCFYA